MAFCAVLFSAHAYAQQFGRVEVFGGYSYLGYYVYPAHTGPWTRNGYNGIEASAAFHLLPHLAAETDFGFEFDQTRIQTYLGGPRLSASVNKADFYVHALFGGLRDTYCCAADTTFAAAVGGGTDYWFNHNFGARFLQADYIRTSTPVGSYSAAPGSHGNFRVSTGFVFRFGH